MGYIIGCYGPDPGEFYCDDCACAPLHSKNCNSLDDDERENFIWHR